MSVSASALCSNMWIVTGHCPNDSWWTRTSGGHCPMSKHLIDLNLQNNEIGLERGKALVEALCMNTTLTSLNLYGNNLELDVREALAVALIPSLG
ncbi:hypothetical protein C2G38_2241355 [Gigaspora rosea]|uniref:Uncharacterized protein n=1 Tax=Gigaspora rosea TaxID=44941 RepID=A0A397VSH3_9GLOM|nr:hypothetical protein C2G38_2241355 [Gigaspora rosea]